MKYIGDALLKSQKHDSSYFHLSEKSEQKKIIVADQQKKINRISICS